MGDATGGHPIPPPPPPTGHPVGPPAGHPDKGSKRTFFIAWSVIWGVILAVAVLYNLYIFGGIDFDNDAFAARYAAAGWISVYGGSVIAWFLGRRFVKRDMDWVWLLVVLLTPVILQLAWLVLSLVLGRSYGYVCC